MQKQKKEWNRLRLLLFSVIYLLGGIMIFPVLLIEVGM